MSSFRYGMVDTVVTVLQGPCQLFVLLESARLALFRSMTVPLVCPVPCCRRFTLHTLSAWFLWLNVVFCGIGWASTSIDNFWPCFTIFYFQATTCSLQQHMLQATFHQVQLAEHTCRKSYYLLLHFSQFAASSSNP